MADQETITGNILIIDDDKAFGEMLSMHFSFLEHQVNHALNLADGFKYLSEGGVDIVFLDVRLPDGNGLSALPDMRRLPSAPEVIIVTGEGDPDGAELAIKSGAWDYIEKPSTLSKMTLPVVRALTYRREKENRPPTRVLQRDRIIGKSAALNACLDLLGQAADSESNVLITGETGTGKEVFAQAIHSNSRRASGRLVVVDCAALSESLLESTLFGHKKGAFTGASADKEGLVKLADGGSLFLDEIGELPLSMQKTFLRVLQEHRFRPLGGKQELSSNFRLIAATNRDLDEMVDEKRFREDLLFRLRTISIHLPPLRERKEDIRDLVLHYLAAFCEREQTATKGFTPEFLEMLLAHNWPGNLRELINTLETTINNARNDQTLFDIHLPVDLRAQVTRQSVGASGSSVSADTPANHGVSNKVIPYQDFRTQVMEAAEKQYLLDLIKASGNTAKKALELSGLSRSWFYELLKKYDLTLRS